MRLGAICPTSCAESVLVAIVTGASSWPATSSSVIVVERIPTRDNPTGLIDVRCEFLVGQRVHPRGEDQTAVGVDIPRLRETRLLEVRQNAISDIGSLESLYSPELCSLDPRPGLNLPRRVSDDQYGCPWK